MIPHCHRFDEFPAGYSLASCSSAELASASPVNDILLDYVREVLEDFSERRSAFIPRVSPAGFTPVSAFLGVRLVSYSSYPSSEKCQRRHGERGILAQSREAFSKSLLRLFPD